MVVDPCIQARIFVTPVAGGAANAAASSSATRTCLGVRRVGGGIVQCVSTTKTDTFTTTSTSFVDVTGLSATITPKFSTSKILVMYAGCASCESTNRMGHVRLVRVVGGSYFGLCRYWVG